MAWKRRIGNPTRKDQMTRRTRRESQLVDRFETNRRRPYAAQDASENQEAQQAPCPTNTGEVAAPRAEEEEESQ